MCSAACGDGPAEHSQGAGTKGRLSTIGRRGTRSRGPCACEGCTRGLEFRPRRDRLNGTTNVDFLVKWIIYPGVKRRLRPLHQQLPQVWDFTSSQQWTQHTLRQMKTPNFAEPAPPKGASSKLRSTPLPSSSLFPGKYTFAAISRLRRGMGPASKAHSKATSTPARD